MKPDWDRLGDTYADSSSVLIGDADCTVEKELCSQYGVTGYPTIKYFTADTPADGERYNGGRGFDQLQTFVKDTLEVGCLLDDDSGCTDKEKTFMAKYLEKSREDVQKQHDRLDGMKGNSMKKDLKVWLNQRLSILKQILER